MKHLILFAFVLLAKSLSAQSLLDLTTSPKYGCPNTTHNVSIGVTNNSGASMPAGVAITVTVTIKDNTNANTLGTASKTISTGFADGSTQTVVVPNIAFVGPMVCNVSGSASFTFGAPQNFPFTGTYTVQYPPTLSISENPTGTLEVTTPLDVYSARYYANANYGVVNKETTATTYTPTVGASYTAKAYDPASTCLSAAASNAVVIKVTPIITFPTLAAVQIGAPDYSPGATSTNTSTAITYASSNTAVATIVSGKIHLVGAGSTTITASQAADVYNFAAADVTQTLTVNATATGVTKILQASISTYPNPASEYVTVKLENANTNEAIGTLTDAAGMEVSSVNFYQTGNALEATIPVMALTKGMYILHIQSDNGSTSTKVFVK